MRISDWSSDVCSSDLAVEQRGPCGAGHNGPPSRTHAMLDTIERETGPSPRHSVIWLHGLGADGGDFVPILPELVRPAWPPIRFVFPHAPVRPVTINNGVPMRAWYDIRERSEEHTSELQSLMRISYAVFCLNKKKTQ